MPSFLRVLLVAAALLSSGALQVAASLGEDECCAEEKGAPCQGCPPGAACMCCPLQGAVQAAAPELAPAATQGAAVVLASAVR
ncbi:MAG: hypothetical protein WCC48_14825, partial [Anaeromyxobacteraceae bacterium]